MSENCFLCECGVSEGHMKTKRKKVSGSSAKKAVDVLNELAAAKYGRLITVAAIDHPNRYICHKCQRRSEGLIDMQVKVECEKEAILKMVDLQFASSVQYSRKINRDDQQVDQPCCTQSSPISSSTSDICSGSTDEIPVSVC